LWVRGGDVVEVAVVVKHAGCGMDGGSGERDVDDTGCPIGAGVPQRGADVEDELIDGGGQRQVEE